MFGRRTGSSRRQKQAAPGGTDGEKTEDKGRKDEGTCAHTETLASDESHCTEHDASEPADDVLSLGETLDHAEPEAQTSKAAEGHEVTGGRCPPVFDVNDDVTDDKSKACCTAMKEQPDLTLEKREAVPHETDTVKEQVETGKETSELEQKIPDVAQEKLEETVNDRSEVGQGKLEVVQENTEVVQETRELVQCAPGLVQETSKHEDERAETANEKFESVQILEIVQDEPEQVEVKTKAEKEKPDHEKYVLIQEDPVLMQEKPDSLPEGSMLVPEKPVLDQEKGALVQEKGSLVEEKGALDQENPAPVQEEIEPAHVRFTLAEEKHKLIQEEHELAQGRYVAEAEPELVQEPQQVEVNPEPAQKEPQLVQANTELSQLKYEPEKPERMPDGSNANNSEEIVGKTGRVKLARPEDQLLSIGEVRLGGKETSAVCSEVLCTTQPSEVPAETSSSVDMTTITPHSDEPLQIVEAGTKTVEGS